MLLCTNEFTSSDGYTFDAGNKYIIEIVKTNPNGGLYNVKDDNGNEDNVNITYRELRNNFEKIKGADLLEDLNNIAVEVDELLKELVQNANAIGPEGNAIFAGTSLNRTAFEIETGPVEGSTSALITNVKYNGSLKSNLVEVDENSYMTSGTPGSQVFWAENQQLIAGRDATTYTVQKDSFIMIDGQEINLKQGDNVYSIISKINNSGAAVKASLDPVTNGLNLSTTDSHQLWLEDGNGDTLYQLGLIKDSTQRPPYNIAPSATVSGGSLFDTVIALRDSLIKGDYEAIGGKVLGGLDAGLDNLTTRLAEVGSRYERALQNISRAETNVLNATAQVSREGDLDITEAITDMKMLEYVQQATLSNAGKMYSSTLLNYMK
jgi:flagellar hook-associated protein 3 FlgL